MRFLLWFVGVFVVLLAALLVFFPQEQKKIATFPETTPVPTPTTAVSQPAAPSSKNPREILSIPRDQLPASVQNESRIRQECFQNWEALRQIDFTKDFQFPPTRTELPVLAHCAGNEDVMKKATEELDLACREYPQLVEKASQGSWNKDTQKCLGALFVYRAKLTHFLTQNVPLETITDEKVLADKLFATFMNGEDFSKADQVAERILALNPNSYLAAKAQAIVKVVNYLQQDGGDQSARIPEIEAAVARARSISDADADQLATMEMVPFMKDETNGPHLIRQKATELISHQPNSGTGYYYLAWAAHKQGQREEAIRALENAIQRSPDHPDYSSTLERLKTSKNANDKVFVLSLQMGLVDLE